MTTEPNGSQARQATEKPDLEWLAEMTRRVLEGVVGPVTVTVARGVLVTESIGAPREGSTPEEIELDNKRRDGILLDGDYLVIAGNRPAACRRIPGSDRFTRIPGNSHTYQYIKGGLLIRIHRSRGPNRRAYREALHRVLTTLVWDRLAHAFNADKAAQEVE